jgi:hypothetical protein
MVNNVDKKLKTRSKLISVKVIVIVVDDETSLRALSGVEVRFLG